VVVVSEVPWFVGSDWLAAAPADDVSGVDDGDPASAFCLVLGAVAALGCGSLDGHVAPSHELGGQRLRLALREVERSDGVLRRGDLGFTDRSGLLLRYEGGELVECCGCAVV
jgi:hypothetical protein